MACLKLDKRKNSWSKPLRAVRISLPGGSVGTMPSMERYHIVALVGTNFSINAAFYTSYGIKEHRRTRADYRGITLVDTIPGTVAPGIMTVLVVMVAAAVLGKTRAEAGTINALASVFAPLAGPVGAKLFALGLSGAAFSSMIANPIAGGTMLSDGLGRGAKAGSPTARIITGTILAFGLIITLTFQSSPVALIVIAQSLTVLIAPMLGVLIVIMANRCSIMGELRNKWWQNLFGAIGLICHHQTHHHPARLNSPPGTESHPRSPPPAHAGGAPAYPERPITRQRQLMRMPPS
jgi:manganese transport protein